MRNLKTQKNIAVACAVALSTLMVSAPVLAKKSETQHVRGIITATSDDGFTVKTNDGEMQKVALSSKTKIAAATPGDLSNIKKGTFIGTANVDHDGKNQALEMVIFPASMKGTGLGNYDWDMSPSMKKPGASNGSMTADSSMTNGTVSSSTSGSMTAGSDSKMGGSSMTNGTVESSSMTNGSVESSTSGADRADGTSIPSRSSMTNGSVAQTSTHDQMLTLKVDYGKGSKTIHVPADVPTVKLQPGSKSDIAKGSHVFIAGPKGSDPFNAQMVIVGLNGTVPPM